LGIPFTQQTTCAEIRQDPLSALSTILRRFGSATPQKFQFARKYGTNFRIRHFTCGIKNRKDYAMNTNDKKPDTWNTNVSDGSNSTTIAIIVAALVLVVGAFIFFGSTSTTSPDQQLTQNNAPPPITEPATPPAAEPVTPLPVTPPANEPATAPAAPPANAPAANP
jgi:hypothetical protein